jgi:sortase B
MWHEDNVNTDKIVDDIINSTVVEEVNETENAEIIGENETLQTDTKKKSIYWSYIKMNLINVDFEELKKKNKDTKGWIQVSGTNINYPFVQAKDNKYYLTHSFEKKYTDAGWVFLDYRNDINNLSKNNIIYGHARLNKTMFGTLKNVLTKNWYNNSDNHVIKLSTEKENTLWQIFSVYSIKTETYYITTDFKNDDDFKKFIDTVKKRSKYKFDANVSVNDTLLTLSTCHKTDEKIVVHAKLIKRETR